MIRPGTDADGPCYRALIAACWAEYTPDSVDVEAEIPEITQLSTALVARGGAIWTAEAAGRIAGMVCTYPAEDSWHLSRMYVAADQRGTGMARDLLHTAEEHARAAGAQRMVLWSDVLFTRAHAFYEKHGYLRRGGLRPLGNLAGSIEAGYAKPLAGRVVEMCDVAAAQSAERPLTLLLQHSVGAGASAGFQDPVGRAPACAYWRSVTRQVATGDVMLFAAWRNGTLGGTAQLVLDTPEDGRHRAEIRMLLVAPGSRCRGLARRLLEELEVAARGAGRRLLTMELRTDEHGAPFYRKAGWMEAGSVPGFFSGAEGLGLAMSLWFKVLA